MSYSFPPKKIGEGFRPSPTGNVWVGGCTPEQRWDSAANNIYIQTKTILEMIYLQTLTLYL